MLLPAPSNPRERLSGVDLCRGLTILGVVIHHVTGAGLAHVDVSSPIYWGVLSVNRMTQLVVPTFLFLSALVFARSAGGKAGFSWQTYLKSRGRQLLWPYLLWTALYTGFQHLTAPSAAHFTPGLWLAEVWNPGLLRGQGYFHLYYLLLALQVAVLLPLVRPVLNRAWRPLWVLGAAAALQLGLYALNLQVLHLRNVGSSVLWYVLPLALGLTLGARPGRLEEVWAGRKIPLIGLGVAALLIYLPFGFAEVRGAPLNPLAYSTGNWSYTTLAALVLTGLSLDWAGRGGKISAALQRLGQSSLQIYLLHPALLWALKRLGFAAPGILFLLGLLLFVGLCVWLPLVFARTLQDRKASAWLFGR